MSGKMKGAGRMGIAGGLIVLMISGISFLFRPGKGGKTKNQVEKTNQQGKRTKKLKKPTLTRKKLTGAPAKRKLEKTPERRPTGRLQLKHTKSAPSKAKAGSLQSAFVLSFRAIYPIQANGSVASKSISLEELLVAGKKAKSVKKEIHLRIRGDAKAKWLRTVKQTLHAQQIPFATTDEGLSKPTP